MSLKIDFSTVKAQTPITSKAWYAAKIVTAKADQSQSGNPLLRIAWKITEGDFEGRTVPDHLSLTGDALWRTGEVLQALGLAHEVDAPDGSGTTYEADEFEPDDLLELEASIYITEKEYQGEKRSNVSKVKSIEHPPLD